MKKKKRASRSGHERPSGSRPSGYLHTVGPSWFLTHTVKKLVEGKIADVRVKKRLGSTSQFDEDQAREVADEFLANLKPEVQPDMTVQQYYERFYRQDIMALDKAASRAHQLYLMESHILPAFGERKIAEIEHRDIQEFINLKAKVVIQIDQKGGTRKGYSHKTCWHFRTGLSRLFRNAKLNKAYWGENPAQDVKLPQKKKVMKLHSLTVRQASDLIAAMPSTAQHPAREMAMCSIMLSLGEAELLGLRWKSLNLTDEPEVRDGEVMPPRSLRVTENYYLKEFGSTKSENRERGLPLPPMIVQALRNHKTRSKWTGDDDVVFGSTVTRGKPLNTRNLKARVLNKVADRLGLKFTFHVGRRSFASITSSMASWSQTERRKFLGHGSDAMTNHYSHAEWDRIQKGVNEIEREIKKPVKALAAG
jgi:integrase